MAENKVVLGAGPVGTRLFEMLTDRGVPARLYSVLGNRTYDMPGTQPQHIDGRHLDAVRSAIQGADTVYLCLNAHYVDWELTFPTVQEAVVDAAAEAGARLISSDPVYIYGKVDGPLTEDLPATAKDPEIGKFRAVLADQLLSAHRAGTVRAAIGRYTDFYGPGCLNSAFGSTFGQRVFYPALKGQRVSVLGDIDLPHTYGYLDDTAGALMTLRDSDRALGEVWHLPNPPTITSRELVEMVFESAGQSPQVSGSSISGLFVRLIGIFSADVRNVADLLYSWEKPFVVDHSKFEQVFGAEVTPHADAVRQTLEWYRANP